MAPRNPLYTVIGVLAFLVGAQMVAPVSAIVAAESAQSVSVAGISLVSLDSSLSPVLSDYDPGDTGAPDSTIATGTR